MAEASLRDFVASVTEDIPTEDLALILMSSDISVAIIRKRVDMGMTQKEFSEYMGVSQAMVSKWESGCANFTLKTLAQIAAKLDVQVRSPFVVDHTPAHLKHRTYLEKINVMSNDLSEIDLSGLTKVKELNCTKNYGLALINLGRFAVGRNILAVGKCLDDIQVERVAVHINCLPGTGW